MVVLTDGVTGTVKKKKQQQEGAFLGALLAPLATSLLQPVMSFIAKGISGRGVRRAGARNMDKKF